MPLRRIPLVFFTYWVVRYWVWLYFEIGKHGWAWFWNGPWPGLTYIMLAFTPIWLLIWLPCLWYMPDADKGTEKDLSKQFHNHVSGPRPIILEQNQYLRINKKTGNAEIIDWEE